MKSSPVWLVSLWLLTVAALLSVVAATRSEAAFTGDVDVYKDILADKSEMTDIRVNAAKKLGELKDKAKPAVATLLKCAVEENDNPVGAAAIETLGLLGTTAKDAVPGLIELLVKQPRKDHAATTYALLANLNRIGMSASEAVLPLTKMVQFDPENVKFQGLVAQTLGDFGADAKGAMPALEAAFELALGHKLPDKFTKKELNAIRVVNDEEFRADELTNFNNCKGLLKKEGDRCCAHIIEAWGKLGSPGEKTIPLMRGYIRCNVFDHWKVFAGSDGIFAVRAAPLGRDAAIRLLGQYGTKEAILELRRLELSDNDAIRKTAIEALGK